VRGAECRAAHVCEQRPARVRGRPGEEGRRCALATDGRRGGRLRGHAIRGARGKRKGALVSGVRSIAAQPGGDEEDIALCGSVLRARDKLVLRTVAGSHVLVPIGERVVDFGGLVVLNETGRFLWERLVGGCGAAELADGLTESFEVPPDEAARDVAAFLAELSAKGLLENARER
jgi:hypothetical protein